MAHDANPGRACSCGEHDCEEPDKLWTDFERCATSMTKMYQDPGEWRNLQTGAAAATSLYKRGIESHKRGYDRGFNAGRQSLAKELMVAMQRQNFGANVIIDILGGVVTMGEDVRRGMWHQLLEMERDGVPPRGAEGDDFPAMFQQALAMGGGARASPAPRGGDQLGEFLTRQMQRHRKRQRSPPSPSALFKRMRR